MPQAVEQHVVALALADAEFAFDEVDEGHRIWTLAGGVRFVVHVEDLVEVEREPVAVCSQCALVFVVGCAVREADEEATERWQEPLDLANVAVADLEVADEVAFAVTEAIPRSDGLGASRAGFAGLLDVGQVAHEREVWLPLLQRNYPGEAYPWRAESALDLCVH